MSKSPLGKKKIKGTGNWPQTCHKNTQFCLQGDDPRPWHSALGEGQRCSVPAPLCPLPTRGPQEVGQCHQRAGPCQNHVLPKPLAKCVQCCMHGGLGRCLNLLSPRRTPVSAPARAALHQGCAGLGAGLQLLWPQPAFGSRALEGTIKKRFALQLKILIKSVSIWMARGKKGSIQSSPFLLNFQMPLATRWGNQASLLVLCASLSQGWLCCGSTQGSHTTDIVPVQTKIYPLCGPVSPQWCEGQWQGNPEEWKCALGATTSSLLGPPAARLGLLLGWGQKFSPVILPLPRPCHNVSKAPASPCRKREQCWPGLGPGAVGRCVLR